MTVQDKKTFQCLLNLLSTFIKIMIILFQHLKLRLPEILRKPIERITNVTVKKCAAWPGLESRAFGIKFLARLYRLTFSATYTFSPINSVLNCGIFLRYIEFVPEFLRIKEIAYQTLSYMQSWSHLGRQISQWTVQNCDTNHVTILRSVNEHF
jgi:hypothetical protein